PCPDAYFSRQSSRPDAHVRTGASVLSLAASSTPLPHTLILVRGFFLIWRRTDSVNGAAPAERVDQPSNPPLPFGLVEIPCWFMKGLLGEVLALLIGLGLARQEGGGFSGTVHIILVQDLRAPQRLPKPPNCE